MRVSFVKVVEMQARAIPHIHALIRLDPTDPEITTAGDHKAHGPAATSGGEHRQPTHDRWEPPVTASELAVLIQQAARTIALDVPNPQAKNDTQTPTANIRFGAQIDTQPLTSEHAADQDDPQEKKATAGRLSPRRVAGYLAKYVTKSLQDLGISARRLSNEAIADLDISDHVRNILVTIAQFSQRACELGIDSLTGIGHWLHTLGYRGHITTKSRRYSTTLGTLRSRRAAWTRQRGISVPGEHEQVTGALVVARQNAAPQTDWDVCWEFDRAGHASAGDRVLVISAAHRHIESRRIGLAEYRTSTAGRRT